MIWLLEGLRLLLRSRSRSALLVLCWSLTLLAAGALGWVLGNSRQFRSALAGRVPAECYLDQEDEGVREAVRRVLAAGTALEWAGYLDRAAAAAEFEAGFGVDVRALLGENPFPPTVLLRVRPEASAAELERHLGQLEELPGVSGTHVDRQLLGDLGRQMRRLGIIVLGAGLLLAALTAGLLAAAVRSLDRAFQGEAALLVRQGARPWQLFLPPATALVLPAAATALVALALLRFLGGLADRLDLPAAGSAPGSLASGIALPLALGLLHLARRARRRVAAGE
jgi:hypothetical protein